MRMPFPTLGGCSAERGAPERQTRSGADTVRWRHRVARTATAAAAVGTG